MAVCLATVESAVVDAPAASVWAAVRPLTFDWCSAVEAVSADQPCSVGQKRVVHRRGGGDAQAMTVLEISDLKRRVAYGIEREGGISQHETITLRAVTESDQTFVEWATEFHSATGAPSPLDAWARTSREQRLEALRELNDVLCSAVAPTPEPEVEAEPPSSSSGGGGGGMQTVLDIRGDREMVTSVERAQELLAPILVGRQLGIREVRLSTKSFGEQAALVLASALKQLSRLEVADVDDIIAGRMDAEALRVMTIVCESLVGKPLVQFNASDNAFGPRGVVACKPALISALGTLERVYFCNNGLSAEAGAIMAEILLAKGPSQLKLLHVHNNMLGEEGAKSLAPLIEQMPRLEDFRFTTTRVPQAGGVVLGNALRCSKNLQRLNLSDNTFGIAGATALAEALKLMPSMRWLILRDTGLTEDGADLVCRASHGFAALETLDLSGNEITEAVVGGALAECLEVHSELLQLLLDDNELEDEGVEALAAILEQPTLLPKLQELTVNFNDITRTGAVCLARVMAAAPRGLAALSLNGNMISAAGLSELESILKAVPSASSGGGATLFDCLGSFSDNDDDASD